MYELVQADHDAVHDLIDHPVDEVVVDLIQQRFRHGLVVHVGAPVASVLDRVGGAGVVHADSPFSGSFVFCWFKNSACHALSSIPDRIRCVLNASEALPNKPKETENADK